MVGLNLLQPGGVTTPKTTMHFTTKKQGNAYEIILIQNVTLCDFLNPAVPLGERVRHDLGVTFAGACS